MKPISIIILLIIVVFSNCIKASEISFSGKYYGYNLYVLNPSTGNGFCIKEVLVNNKPTNDEINSNSFEIDFSLLDIKIGDPVNVLIKFTDGCNPQVVNPNALNSNSPFSFSTFKADKSGVLNWVINGSINEDPFIIEQYRWNKWIQIGEVPVNTLKPSEAYSFTPNIHFGVNQFRIVHYDNSGNPVYSKTVKFSNLKGKEITVENTKVVSKISFSGETIYEIFDNKGNFILGGADKEVDVSDLKKGNYWLNYDNKTITISKK